MTVSSFTDDLTKLALSPSEPLWELEIARILAGKRDHAIDRLQSVQEYIEVLHARSSDEECSRVAFHQALRNLVESWQSTRPASAYYFATMLSLIGAYTPTSGFVKILGHLMRWGRFGKNVIVGSAQLYEDLHLKALKVLENYFPAPPPLEQESPGFVTYLSLLRQHLGERDYSGHALRRLIELGVLQITDEDAVQVIRRNLETIKELVQLFLTPTRRQTASRDLALTYIEATVSGENVDGIFAEAARACRARFEPSVPPAIVFESGEVIKFYFSAEELEKYGRLHDRESHVREIASAIHQTREPSLIEEFTRIFEETLERSNEEITRMWHAVGESGMYLAHGYSGPYLYLPQEIEIPLRLTERSLNTYLMKVRFGAEPELEVQRFVRNVRARAAGA